MGIFGKSTGTNANPIANFGSGYIYGQRFALSEAGTVVSLSIWGQYSNANQVMRLCIYDDNGSNKPGNLQGVTAEMTCDSSWNSYAQHTGNITPVALAAGDYFLCQWMGNTASKFTQSRDAGTGTSYGGYKAVTYHATNSPGNIAGAWTAMDFGTRWILATYTVPSFLSSVMRPHIIPAQIGG
jgi:hypothetical protein